MRIALRSVASAVAQVWFHLGLSILGNLVAVIACIPLLILLFLLATAVGSLGVLPLGIAFLLGILPNPAGAGLQYIQLTLADKDVAYPADILTALRTYARPVLVIWLISLVVTVILAANAVFYSHFHTLLFHVVALVWVYLTVMWLAMHLYVYPLLLRQEKLSPLTTYRNAVVIVISRPLVTLCIFPLWILVLLITSGSGLGFVIGLSLAAAIQHQATRRLVPTFQTAVSDHAPDVEGE